MAFKGEFIIHKQEMAINKEKLKDLLNAKGMDYTELWNKSCDQFGLDISYKGFMHLLSNQSTWKLLYAHAVCDLLNVDYREIFEIVKVDIEKTKSEKEEFRRRWGNKKRK